MEKIIKNILTANLLSEIETLKIHGGLTGGSANPNALNVFCDPTKCKNCTGTDEPKLNQTCTGDINVFC